MSAGKDLAFPRLWLGQPTDTRVLTTCDPNMASWPSLLSLGDVIRRPRAQQIFQGAVGPRLGLNGPILIDSGGFTLSQRGAVDWTPEKVRGIYDKLQADLFVSLDYPPKRADNSEDRLRKILAGAEAYRVLADSSQGKLIVPVVHGRTVGEIDFSCATISQSGFRGKTIGIGGLVPLLQRSARDGRVHHFIAGAIHIVRERFPEVAIHIFGAGSPQTLKAVFALGAASADSLAWRHVAAFGGIYLKGSAQRLVAWSDDNRVKPRPMVGPNDFDSLADCRCPICTGHLVETRISRLKKRFANRAIHNAWTLYQEFVPWREQETGRKALDFALRELSPNWLSAIEASATSPTAPKWSPLLVQNLSWRV